MQTTLALDLPPATEAPPRARLTGRVRLTWTSFGVTVDLSDVRHACQGDGVLYAYLVSRLSSFGHCQIRQTADQGTRSIKARLRLDRISDTDGGMFLPHGALPLVRALAEEVGLQLTEANDRPQPPCDHASLQLPFRSDRTLDAKQVALLTAAFTDNGSAIFNCSMGAGKSLMVAATLRAYQTLRPAIVTGDKASDTVQLATTLAEELGERVCLLGCAGVISASDRRRLFVRERDIASADIVVGTHLLFQHTAPIPLPCSGDSNALPTPARGEVKRERNEALGAIVSTAPLLLMDEADGFPTLRNTEHLLGCTPARVFGFSGTWKVRSDRMDNVLMKLLDVGPNGRGVYQLDHQTIVAHGRVTSICLTGYEFSEVHYPPRTAIGANTPRLLHRLVLDHDGRHRFCAELIEHVRRTATGTTLVYSKTIQHSLQVLWHWCSLTGHRFDQEALRAAGVLLHNAQLKRGEVTANVEAIKSGAAKLVITTDTLAVGLDSSAITDVIDITGTQEKRLSIQRAGRTVRPDAEKALGRYHFVQDTHHPALRGIAARKRAALEAHFLRPALIYASGCLPWFAHGPVAPSDELVARVLAQRST